MRAGGGLLGASLLAACGGGGDASASPGGSPGGGDAPAPAPRPQPSPPGQAFTTLTLTSASGGAALPFSSGQAFRQGDVPAGHTVRGDLPGFQCAIKSRWPDGSARFAVVSGLADLQAGLPRVVPLKAAEEPVPSGPAVTLRDLAATGLEVILSFAPHGEVGWRGEAWLQPHRTWIEGPVMSSWIYRQPVGTDAHLVAWLEVRCYRGGQVEVLVWLENGYLLVPEPGERSGRATLRIGGQQRLARDLTLLNHQRAVLAEGESVTHLHGGSARVLATHDVDYLMGTRVVPRYAARTSPTSRLFDRLPTRYEPLMQGAFPSTMGTAGYHPSIGLLPEWDVAYLTSGADARALRSVVLHGCAAGRYGIHFRDETTQQPLRFSAYPYLTLGSGSGVQSVGTSSRNQATPAAQGGVPPRYTTSHHPSMGYMAYLLTGWHYFLEEVQFVATLNHLKQRDGTRQGSLGILSSSAGANTIRGAAWALRTLAQAAMVTPEDDPLHAELRSAVDENIRYYHGRYVARPHNPLGVVQPYSNYNGSNDPWTSASWMDDFFTATFGYMKDLQVHGPDVDEQLEAFVQWKYRAVVGRLGGDGPDEFSYRHGAKYVVNYAPTAKADWANGTGPWYSGWGEVARAMGLPQDGVDGQPLVSGNPTSPTGYWGNLMPALAYAVAHGAPGAARAWARVRSAPNFARQRAGYDDQPVWSVLPTLD